MTKIDTVVGITIGVAAANCTGKFASGTLPTDQKGERHAFAACNSENETFMTSYFIVPRKDGVHYVFAVVGKQDDAVKADSGFDQPS